MKIHVFPKQQVYELVTAVFPPPPTLPPAIFNIMSIAWPKIIWRNYLSKKKIYIFKYIPKTLATFEWSWGHSTKNDLYTLVMSHWLMFLSEMLVVNELVSYYCYGWFGKKVPALTNWWEKIIPSATQGYLYLKYENREEH